MNKKDKSDGELIVLNDTMWSEVSAAPIPDMKLPNADMISTDSDSFFEAGAIAFPDERREEFKNLAKKRNQTYSRFQVFLCLMALAAIGLIFYAAIKEDRKFISSNTLLFPSETIQEKSDNYINAAELYEKKEYKNVIVLLSPEIDRYIDDETLYQSNRPLLELWFSAIQNSPDLNNGGNLAAAVSKLNKLLEKYPDEPVWHCYRMIIANYNITRLDQFNIRQKNGNELARLENEVKYFRNLEITDNPELRRRIDLAKTKILIALWRGYMAYNPGQTLQSKTPNGVIQREEAYRIAKNYPTDPDFLALRKFIVENIKVATKWHNHYHFDGIERFREDALDTELNFLKNELGKYVE